MTYIESPRLLWPQERRWVYPWEQPKPQLVSPVYIYTCPKPKPEAEAEPNRAIRADEV